MGHDIPLKNADGTVNFICEIPKETSAKMEVATDEPKNPIKQDTKKGKLRFYPYNINWNYGLIPQTWEDPGVEREFPGEIQKILEWFRDYKIPDGKPANAFGYDNKCMSAAFAMDVVDETNEFYNKLKSGERGNTEELALE